MSMTLFTHCITLMDLHLPQHSKIKKRKWGNMTMKKSLFWRLIKSGPSRHICTLQFRHLLNIEEALTTITTAGRPVSRIVAPTVDRQVLKVRLC